MAGYIRQDIANNIANGNVINADDINGEIEALEDAFASDTGHSHDGSIGEGAPITVVGPGQDVTVSTSAILPKTDNIYDLGSSALQFKDLYIDGVGYIDTLTADAGTIGGVDIVTTTDTQTLTNKTLTSPTIAGGTLDGNDLSAAITKLNGIEAGADVTDTANVTAAGALMDSEVTNLAAVKAFDPTDYATAAQGALADSATQPGDNISTLTNDSGFTTNTGTVTSVAATQGTGISVTGSPITTSGTLTITNTAPDQTVILNNGTGISTTGTYPNFTITNTAPDQTVSLTEGSNITITGTYPNFTIAASSTTFSEGTGIDITGDTISNTAPDQTVTLTEGSNVTITGNYPDFTIAAADTTYSNGTGLSLTGTTFSIDNTVVTTTGTQTLTNKTLTTPAISTPTMTGTIVEDVYALSGTSLSLEPDNGSIQTHTLSGTTTYSDGFSSGQAITLMINDGSARTVSWPTMTWVNNGGSAPTLATTGYTVVALWKVGSTLYGALVGDGS